MRLIDLTNKNKEILKVMFDIDEIVDITVTEKKLSGYKDFCPIGITIEAARFKKGINKKDYKILEQTKQ